MATKAEYIASLDSRAEWVGNAVEQELDPNATGGELQLYNIPLLVKLPNGTFRGEQQGFYVFDEGGAGETVYPVNQERKNNPPSQFEAQLATFVSNQINATRLKIVTDQINNDHEFAIVTAYELANNEISPQRYFVAKDGNGDPFIRKYVEA